MAQANRIEKLYVELDCLLDTRLGTIAQHWPETASAIVASGEFHKREVDNFAGVDTDAYQQAYSRRNVVTLMHSVATNLFGYLLKILGQLETQALLRPYHDSVAIDVNIHPYVLSAAEKEEMVKMIAHRIRGLARVSLVDIKPEQLDPKHCKSSYGAMFMYDPWTWMNLQSDAFATTRLPEVILYAPKIYTNRRPSDDELAQLTKDAPHPFTAMEMYSSPIVGLTLIEVANFSSSIRPS